MPTISPEYITRWSIVLTAFAVCACGTRAPVLLVDLSFPEADSDAGADAMTDDAGPEVALDLLRALPSHGSFEGGNLVILRGAGFVSSSIAVTVDGVALSASDVRRIDPNRLEVVAPPHAPGVVAISVSDGTITRTLASAYTYDSIAVSPSAGPPSGGTLLTLTAASATFASGLAVELDGAPCTSLEILSPRSARCRTPAHPLGVADLRVTIGDSALVLADAYTYENPFRSSGGLGGGPLDGTLTILVRDANLAPAAGALVVAGRDGNFPYHAVTGADGTVVFTGDDLRGRVDVFATENCHHVSGFAGLDAAYVTVGLRLAQLGCLPGGGVVGFLPNPIGDVEGTIVFFGGLEFQEPTLAWTGVPEPAAGESRAAIVGFATGRQLFGDGATATVYMQARRVTEADGAGLGYRFRVEDLPAGESLVPFALAGLASAPSDDMSEAGFVPYVVGVGEAFVVRPAATVRDVEVRMDTPLGLGRRVSATLPSPVPTLWDGDFGDPVHTAVSLDRLDVLVRYGGPGLAGGLPLFGSGDDLRGAPEGVTVARQPTAVGSFAAAEQELTVILTSSGSSPNFYENPHSRVLVRAPLDTTQVHVDAAQFLPIANFTAPSTSGAEFPADRTVRFTMGAGGASMLVFKIENDHRSVFLMPTWYIHAHPSVRAVTLPDFSVESGFFDLIPSERIVSVGA